MELVCKVLNNKKITDRNLFWQNHQAHESCSVTEKQCTSLKKPDCPDWHKRRLKRAKSVICTFCTQKKQISRVETISAKRLKFFWWRSRFSWQESEKIQKKCIENVETYRCSLELQQRFWLKKGFPWDRVLLYVNKSYEVGKASFLARFVLSNPK